MIYAMNILRKIFADFRAFSLVQTTKFKSVSPLLKNQKHAVGKFHDLCGQLCRNDACPSRLFMNALCENGDIKLTSTNYLANLFRPYLKKRRRMYTSLCYSWKSIEGRAHLRKVCSACRTRENERVKVSFSYIAGFT